MGSNLVKLNYQLNSKTQNIQNMFRGLFSICGRTLNGSVLQTVQKVLSFIKKFGCLPIGSIHVSEKKMDDAQTQNLGPLMHTFGVYNKTQNLYLGSNLCDQTHLGWAIGQSG
jgi:hypothetical protein